MPFLDISQVGVPIGTRDRDELRYCCVYCEDSGYHLYVNTRKKLFNCFRCGTKGRTNISTDGISETRLDDINTEGDRTALAAPIELPKAVKGKHTAASLRYLDRRGLKESDVIRHQIYCASPESVYFGRVIVPCKPRYGFCTYFAARAYTKLAWPKYLNPRNGKQNLFIAPPDPDPFFDQYWHAEELVLVEGPFDMLKASRHGPAAALLGKQLSNQAAREIVSKFTKVYILLDDGIPEQAAAIEIEKKLRIHVDTEIVGCPKHDPGEMEPDDFRGLFT